MTRRAACRAVLALGWAIASGSHPWEEGAWARVATACELVPSALLNASSPCERGWERPSPAPREPGAAAALGACYASNASLPGTPHQLLREFCVPSVWLLGPEKTGTTALFYKLVQARERARETFAPSLAPFRTLPSLTTKLARSTQRSPRQRRTRARPARSRPGGRAS